MLDVCDVEQGQRLPAPRDGHGVRGAAPCAAAQLLVGEPVQLQRLVGDPLQVGVLLVPLAPAAAGEDGLDGERDGDD